MINIITRDFLLICCAGRCNVRRDQAVITLFDALMEFILNFLINAGSVYYNKMTENHGVRTAFVTLLLVTEAHDLTLG